ncbi:MAG: DUF4124 domain-containing protein [Thiobacillaceae bacterium]|nr:DUF4124 domain-containing protein [Thiobacillaceae bacterium]MDW8323321.1 DUF4124 domain-containing protein [Burkholderiales bacterium]
MRTAARFRRPAALAGCLALLVAGPAAHAGVYKWTDAQGRVHYSDVPPPQQPVQTVNTGRSQEAEAAQARKALADKLLESELKRRQAQEQEEGRRLDEQAQRKRAESCRQAREQLALLQRSDVRPLRVDADGRRQPMSAAEREAAVAERQRFLEQHCR